MLGIAAEADDDGNGATGNGKAPADADVPKEIQRQKPSRRDDPPPPDEPGSHDGPDPEIPIFVGTIDEMWEKSGVRKDRKGNEIPWTLYNLRVTAGDGESLVFGTFDTAHVATAKDIGQGNARITWEPTVKGNKNIISIEAA
jgi:hypothetical protein